MKSKKKKTKNDQSGAALLLTLLLISVMLAISFSLAGIFIPKIRQSVDAKFSTNAFYAAESGVEWCLYSKRVGVPGTLTLSNGAVAYDGNEGTLETTDCDATTIKVIGTYQGVSRALEVSF